LQGDGLAGSGGAGDQSVAVGLVGQQAALDSAVVCAMYGLSFIMLLRFVLVNQIIVLIDREV
jgi:hypothetical protein